MVFGSSLGDEVELVSSKRPPLRIEVAGDAAPLPNSSRALLPVPTPEVEIPPNSLALADIFLSTYGEPEMEFAADEANTTS